MVIQSKSKKHVQEVVRLLYGKVMIERFTKNTHTNPQPLTTTNSEVLKRGSRVTILVNVTNPKSPGWPKHMDLI